MSTYAIGDIQGCFLSFQKLLEQISYNPSHDQLWLVGDLVNRGPRSLEMLRWCLQNQKNIHVVLGNHDIHLLCRAAHVSPEKPLDTLDEVLQAPDLYEICEWLRNQSFIHHHNHHLLVHGGVLPTWSLSEIIHYNKQAQAKLTDKDWVSFLDEVRNSETPDELVQALRVFTQLRMCNTEGKPEFKFKGNPQKAPEELIPWYSFPDRQTANETVVFGHWAALGLLNEVKVIALDTGCVWGKKLSAVRLEDRTLFQQEMIDNE